MNNVNETLSMMAETEVKSTVERILVITKAELAAFERGEKDGNFGITKLSKEVAAKAAVTLDFATAVCTAYTRRAGFVAKKGPKGGFQRSSATTPPPAVKAAEPSYDSSPEVPDEEPAEPVATAESLPVEETPAPVETEESPETAPLSHAAE